MTPLLPKNAWTKELHWSLHGLLDTRFPLNINWPCGGRHAMHVQLHVHVSARPCNVPAHWLLGTSLASRNQLDTKPGCGLSSILPCLSHPKHTPHASLISFSGIGSSFIRKMFALPYPADNITASGALDEGCWVVQGHRLSFYHVVPWGEGEMSGACWLRIENQVPLIELHWYSNKHSTTQFQPYFWKGSSIFSLLQPNPVPK